MGLLAKAKAKQSFPGENPNAYFRNEWAEKSELTQVSLTTQYADIEGEIKRYIAGNEFDRLIGEIEEYARKKFEVK